MGIKQKQIYRHFEQGPIRPPSEANSLLIRVTRNCPWNKCSFCAVYKREKFSLRTVEHIIRDIDLIHQAVSIVSDETGNSGTLATGQLDEIENKYFAGDRNVFYTAVNWMARGEGSVFLQDANSLIIKPDDLKVILDHLLGCFPWITRITSYARSHTINRISGEKLEQLAQAGLNRIHIGMESGSDEVLEKIDKGVTKQGHIDAGQKVKKAGIELSEYVMPGLGGVDLSEQHAVETADALNQINADFIRLRTLAIVKHTPLFEQHQKGEFRKCTDLQIAGEIRTFIQNLDGISSVLKSDHFRNLLQEIEGEFPDDKEQMLKILDQYLALSPADQTLYQLGRRAGFFRDLAEMQSGTHRSQVEHICEQWQITPENVDQVIEENIKHTL